VQTSYTKSQKYHGKHNANGGRKNPRSNVTKTLKKTRLGKDELIRTNSGDSEKHPRSREQCDILETNNNEREGEYIRAGTIAVVGGHRSKKREKLCETEAICRRNRLHGGTESGGVLGLKQFASVGRKERTVTTR